MSPVSGALALDPWLESHNSLRISESNNLSCLFNIMLLNLLGGLLRELSKRSLVCSYGNCADTLLLTASELHLSDVLILVKADVLVLADNTGFGLHLNVVLHVKGDALELVSFHVKSKSFHFWDLIPVEVIFCDFQFIELFKFLLTRVPLTWHEPSSWFAGGVEGPWLSVINTTGIAEI